MAYYRDVLGCILVSPHGRIHRTPEHWSERLRLGISRGEEGRIRCRTCVINFSAGRFHPRQLPPKSTDPVLGIPQIRRNCVIRLSQIHHFFSGRCNTLLPAPPFVPPVVSACGELRFLHGLLSGLHCRPHFGDRHRLRRGCPYRSFATGGREKPGLRPVLPPHALSSWLSNIWVFFWVAWPARHGSFIGVIR